ncbi:unnamed protein product [Cercopithifilaria johnstoni]|uniref:Peptidase A1 domain-containing protein n=1 Tax=Cercopithifilaria johnstoni TaxID=2874296 RepID=A0A8J2LUX3_9BILA|nr:unnamed protein product [Cercopithifilaria johnstoni]
MTGTLINLTIIFCCLQVTSIFAEHQVELYPIYNKSNQHIGYAAKVMIGESKKEFSLLLDTVTAFLWVFPPSYHQIISREMKTYSERESSFMSDILYQKQTYGSREVELLDRMDTIMFNLTDASQLHFIRTAFGVVNNLKWSKWDDYQKTDGVLGLSAFHVDGIPSGVICQSLYNRSITSNPVKVAVWGYEVYPFVTIALPPLDSDNKAILTLGGRNDESCDWNYGTTELLRLNYLKIKPFRSYCETNVSSSLRNTRFSPLLLDQSGNRYEFEYNSIKMGNVAFPMKSFAYLNTIEPYIGLPIKFLQKIVNNLNATKVSKTEKKYMIRCEQPFEPFEISTNHNTYIVPPEHFIIKHNPDDTLCELAFTVSERTARADEDAVLLGIPFFHQYCVTLRPHHKHINFAPII